MGRIYILAVTYIIYMYLCNKKLFYKKYNKKIYLNPRLQLQLYDYYVSCSRSCNQLQLQSRVEKSRQLHWSWSWSEANN
jgi:hypothetical protein